MKKSSNNEDWKYVPLEDTENYYYCEDIDVAACLIAKRYTLVDISPINEIKATFIFQTHLTLSDTIKGFWDNTIEVHPLEFANARKNLKSRIYTMNKHY